MSSAEHLRRTAIDLMRVVLLLLMGIVFFGDDLAASAPIGEGEHPTISLDAGDAHFSGASRSESSSTGQSPGALALTTSVETRILTGILVPAAFQTRSVVSSIEILRYAPSHSPPHA